MIQKRARARLGVLNEEPTPRLRPDLRVRTRYDLGLERELVGAERVGGSEAKPSTVCESSDAKRRIALAHVSADRVETKGAARVEVGDETDAM